MDDTTTLASEPPTDPYGRGRPAWSTRDLESFMSLITHEVRTPLAVVTAAGDTLRVALEAADHVLVADLLDVIERNTHLAALLLDRFGLTRDIERDTVVLDTTVLDLTQLVQDSVSDLALMVLGDHATAVLSDGPVTITADATAVREILFNLLTNAAKYSHRHASIEVRVTGGPLVAEVVVRNHGSGVTQADTERIFDQFVQGDERSRGIGLGLYVARGLARAHGGDLCVRPAAVEGSEFVLELPLS